MADSFDPHSVWLAIPPEEQPPNHYRLLGVPLFSDNLETIEHAADQRMMLLRTFRAGKHAAEAGSLLNEVAAARICLLNADKRAAYDLQLRKALQPVGSAGSGGDETVEWAGLQELGNYRFIEKLGEGGMGAVFKALHATLGRVVAVKLVRSDHAWDERAIARFEREMRATGAVDHPNVVRAMDAGEIGGTRFLAMEFVNGLTATDLVRRCHPLPVAGACEIIRQAALGLQAAHEHNLIHRDIKTSNLMVARDGTVKILDLGLARFQREGSHEEGMTGAGQTLGTIDYMAPEQLAESRSVDIRADIYSLGCTFYALLAGHAPFATAEYEGTIKKAIAHAEQPVPPIRQLRADVPAEVARIVGRMLEKDAAKRFATPGEVAEALGPLTVGHKLPALVARAENRPAPQAQPAGAMTDTRDSSSSGLTKFFQAIKGQPEAATVAGRAAGKSPWPKAAVITACVGVGLVCALAVVMLALRGGASSTVEETALVLDWPDAERVGANLNIDGKEAAVSRGGSLRYPCEPGEHQLRITRPEFKPFEQTIVVEAGREARLRPVWLAESHLILQWPLAEQRNAAVEIDGIARNLSTLPRGDDWADIRVPIEPGPHQLLISRKGYEPFEHRVTVEAGKNVTVTPQWKASVETAAAQPSVSAGKPPEGPMPAASQATVPQPAALAAEQGENKHQSESSAPKPDSPQGISEPAPALKRQQELDAKYARGMESVEKLVAAWDFRGAWAALDGVRFEDPELTARLAQRREEIRRMGSLKVRMIAKISAADPPLKKTDLMLRGVNGQVTKADEEAITAQITSGKSELHPWPEMSDKCRERLVELVIDPQSADDHVAAGLVLLTSGGADTSERLLEKARSLGADINPFLIPLASAALAQVNALMEQEKWAEAEKALAKLPEKYGGTRRFEEIKPLFDAAMAKAARGVHETEAEKLYRDAARLFNERDLFGLRELIAELKADYPESLLLTDAERKPSFPEMEKVIEILGMQVTVRLDGKGDFRSVQEAIEASPANSLIEIQDNGPYNEKVSITKEGVTVRGKKGVWPIITSAGETRDFPVLVRVTGGKVTLERLLLIHAAPAGESTTCLVSIGSTGVRSCIMYGGKSAVVGGGTYEHCIIGGSELQSHVLVRNSVCLSLVLVHRLEGTAQFQNVLMLISPTQWSPCQVELHGCTISGHVKVTGGLNVVRDCILPSVESSRPDTRIEHCNVYKTPPFADLAKPGKGCFGIDPQFVDPKNLDYRLRPTSPCRGQASDGGDVGCRYTPEMVEMCKIALELRAKGIIKF